MKQVSIEEFDKNLKIVNNLPKDELDFFDVREEPFRVYGLYDYKAEGKFRRMPMDVAKTVNSGVAGLSENTAGGRVRFSTDSDYIAIRAVMPYVCRFAHMQLSGSAGFDLYVDDEEIGRSRFKKSFIPPYNMEDGYESGIQFPSKKMRSFTIHFPSYSNVSQLLVGVRKGSRLGEGQGYVNDKPVVYYGSSITQGACASRPGNSYQNMIALRMGLDYVNLGFSGNALGEVSMANYMAKLPMCAFVSDYDHNVDNAQQLEETHYRMYEIIRKENPDIPYIMVSRPDFDNNFGESLLRRDVIFESYKRAREKGDRNVYYIDGASIFRGAYEDMCTVDATHPNDLGFALMADAIGAELKRAFTQLKLEK